MGDPTPADRLGIGRTLTDILRRVRNIEKSIRRRLTVASLFASGDLSAGGNVTGANVAAFATVSGTSVNASVSMASPRASFDNELASLGVRNNPLTDNPIALAVDANGDFGYIPSSQEMKTVLGDYMVDMSAWLSQSLKRFTYVGDPDGRVSVGWLAEDLDAAGLREFVVYAKDGTIQGVRVETLVAGLHSAYVQSRVQSQSRLTAMEQSVATSASNVTAVQKSVTDLTMRVGTDETAATALTGRVTTLEGKQSSYALGTDLTALTTRVTTAETTANALAARVKALEEAAKTKLRQRVTSTSMAALTVLNSSQTVTITWPTAFADANYTPTIVSVTPPSGVLTTINARVTAQTATTVTLLVYTSGIAVSAGTTITVDGIHL